MDDAHMLWKDVYHRLVQKNEVSTCFYRVKEKSTAVDHYLAALYVPYKGARKAGALVFILGCDTNYSQRNGFFKLDFSNSRPIHIGQLLYTLFIPVIAAGTKEAQEGPPFNEKVTVVAQSLFWNLRRIEVTSEDMLKDQLATMKLPPQPVPTENTGSGHAEAATVSQAKSSEGNDGSTKGSPEAPAGTSILYVD